MYRKYDRKGQLGKIWIPTSLRIKSSRKQSASHPSLFLPDISCYLLELGWNLCFQILQREHTQKVLTQIGKHCVSMQTIHSCKVLTPNVLPKHFFAGEWEGNRGRKRKREKGITCREKIRHYLH